MGLWDLMSFGRAPKICLTSTNYVYIDFDIPLVVKGKITLHVLKRLFYSLYIYIGISAIKISRK